MVAFVKNRLISVSKTRCFNSVVSLLERYGSRSQQLLRVVTFHRVDEEAARPNLYPGMISATPRVFREQIELLASRFNVVSLTDVLSALRNEAPLASHALLFTFDDAYCDFAEHAWPVMRRFGIPPTLFVPTDYPDQPTRHFWWDRLYRDLCLPGGCAEVALTGGRIVLQDAPQRLRVFKQVKEYVKSLPHEQATRLLNEIHAHTDKPEPESNGVLSWDELRLLHAEGVTLAPHTRTHPMLNQISEERARSEVCGAWAELDARIGPGIPRVLAYPAGGVDAQITAMLEDAEFEAAFTTRRGINDLSESNPLLLNRINVGRRTTPAILRVQLLSQFRLLKQC